MPIFWVQLLLMNLCIHFAIFLVICHFFSPNENGMHALPDEKGMHAPVHFVLDYLWLLFVKKILYQISFVASPDSICVGFTHVAIWVLEFVMTFKERSELGIEVDGEWSENSKL